MIRAVDEGRRVIIGLRSGGGTWGTIDDYQPATTSEPAQFTLRKSDGSRTQIRVEAVDWVKDWEA